MLCADKLLVKRGAQTVLQDVSVTLQPGEVLGVLGPNGAGKSTLLGAMSGELPLAGGAVSLDGRPLDAWRGTERARRLAVLAQSSSLSFAFTVEAVVGLSLIHI